MHKLFTATALTLALLAMPAKASTIIPSSGQYEVIGEITGEISILFQFTGGFTGDPVPIISDPYDQTTPFYTVGGAATINGTSIMNEVRNCTFFPCNRVSQLQRLLTVESFDDAHRSIDITLTLYGGHENNYALSYTAPDGISIAAVPEPSTWAMLIVGFIGIAALARRRRAFA